MFADEFEDTHHELFLCGCNSIDHQFVLSISDWRYEYEKEEDVDERATCNIQVFFHDMPFWQRVRQAINLILGYKTRYGHWDFMQLSYDDTVRLIAGLNRYKDLVDKHRAAANKSND